MYTIAKAENNQCYNERSPSKLLLTSFKVKFQEIATKSKEDALAFFSATVDGLSSSAAKRKFEKCGANKLTGKETRWWEVFFRQFRSAFIYLLFAAAVVAFLLGEYLDAGIIFLFLLVNAFLGFYQEYRAEHALRSLKEFVDRKTRLLRDGKEVLVSVAGVVPGDIVLLDAGDMIPADGYFLRADAVTVDESAFSGETMPAQKHSGQLSKTPNDIYEAANIGFARTTLTSGDALLLVYATGNDTEIGMIAEKMHEAESPSAFEEGVSKFSSFVLKLIFATVPIVFLLHTLVQGDGASLGEFLLFSIALMVSAIPEALPLVTTISLSRGALALAKKHVVPRRLSAIEDLGSIDVLCTDKTGTITENKLAVAGVYGKKEAVFHYALMSAVSDKDVRSAQNSVFDAALLAEDHGVERGKLAGISRRDELPFDPVRRCESVLVTYAHRTILCARGAPEKIFRGGEAKAALAWAKKEGEKGRRVLAVAYKEIHDLRKDVIVEADEKELTPVGMISFSDPLKPSTKKAVLHARELGVRVKVITGDSKEVAGWVGVEAGILNFPSKVLLGSDFMRMTPEGRSEAVEAYDVFARTTPVQKFAIIKELEEKHLVGFLGEGFNDAPALKIAHVGLAVSGASDIAQDASDIVLLNKSLEVIVDGIREGRTIFANSIKYIRATLTSNFGNFYALAFSSLFIPYLPMLPIQILLLNLLSDFPMITIAADNVDKSELRRPRGYHVGELTAVALVLGVVSTLFDFAFFGYFMRFEAGVLQTMWFMGSILTELVLLFSIRTALPFWRAQAPSSTVLWLTLSVMVFTVAIPFIPLFREIFGFVIPTAAHLAMTLLLVILYFAATEAAKLLFYKYWASGTSEKNGLSVAAFQKTPHHHGLTKKRLLTAVR